MHEAIARPYGFAQRVFSDAVDAHGGGVPVDVAQAAVLPAFEAVVRELPEDEARRVPVLTAKAASMGRHKSGTLVRYRGMVQDMAGPVYYPLAVEMRNKDTGTPRRPAPRPRGCSRRPLAQASPSCSAACWPTPSARRRAGRCGR